MGFGKGSRGPRAPRQKASSNVVPAAKEESAVAVEVLEADEDKEYFFKSKERELEVTLIKPTKTHNADGTRTIDPGYTARFERNSWKAPDAYKAGLMRSAIAERDQKHNPLGVWEATPE